MTDWKEERITKYLNLENEKKGIEKEMDEDKTILDLQRKADKIALKLQINKKEYKEEIANLDLAMCDLKDQLDVNWDLDNKTFKCVVGSATMRITRSLKIDNTEELINILEKIGKLTKCIKSWDLTYLRKLADAGLFDGEKMEEKITHYDEKRSIIIRGTKEGEAEDEE